MTEWAAKIREGDARALARAATAVENRDPQSFELLRELAPFTGHARVVGITGPPGAGKSTLVDALVAALRRQHRTVAIIAVDPSSRATGGAVLGDRIRMQQHHGDPGVFIRSMATRGATGGLARATAGLVRLMDAAGKDYVLIETVGVGQDEVDIASLAQVTVVVLVPGMGDDVQAIKAGMMEIADIFVINKADQPGADRVERELQAMLSLSAEGRKPGILHTVATEGKGIDALLDQLNAAEVRACHTPAVAVTIDHLGIAVEDLASAIRLYEALGFAAPFVEKPGVAVLPAGEPRIELLAGRGTGLHHIALRVPDLQAAVERLRAAGARLENEACPGTSGHHNVFVHPASTGGVLLELIQENDS